MIMGLKALNMNGAMRILAILSIVFTPLFTKAADTEVRWLGFDTPVKLPIGYHEKTMHAGDIDDDFDQDLVFIIGRGSDISVLHNLGEGMFKQYLKFNVRFELFLMPRVSNAKASSICLGDFDNDNNLDLAFSAVNHGRVAIMYNEGGAVFEKTVCYGVGQLPQIIVAEDLDYDGDLDIITANSGSKNISILFNNGDRVFQNEINYPAVANPLAVVPRDFDGDDIVDLIVADKDTSRVLVLLNDGRARFKRVINIDLYKQLSPFYFGSYTPKPTGFYVHDFDGDLDLDMALLDTDHLHVFLCINNGDWTFEIKKNEGFIFPCHITGGDLDNDGDIDMVVTGLRSVFLFINDGNGAFKTTAIPEIGSHLAPIIIVDLDNDSALDLITSDFGSGEMTILYNLGWEYIDRGVIMLSK